MDLLAKNLTTPRRALRQVTRDNRPSRLNVSGAVRFALLSLGIIAFGCVPAAAPPLPTPTGPSRLGTLPAFAFDSLDERPVVSEAFRGKPLLLAFFSTWDLASQAQTRVMLRLTKEFPAAKLQMAMVAVEEHKNRELVEAYRAALGLPFPVALAEPAGMASSDAFAGLRVPAVYLFDAAGRIVFERSAMTTEADSETVLRAAIVRLLARP
jgi:thiol-disulfide isomerase/thioredoxin